MKRLNEFIQVELANLSEEDIQNIIDVECAFEGVRLLPPEPVRPTLKVFEPDVCVYEVNGFKFENQEDALNLIELLKNTKLVNYTYDSSVGYNYDYITDKKVDIPTVYTKKVFSKENFVELKTDMQNTKKLKDSYDSQMNLYNDVVKERKTVVDSVYEAINEAVEKENEKKRIISQYNRYLVLADNDITTAKKFLADALHMTTDEVNNLELA